MKWCFDSLTCFLPTEGQVQPFWLTTFDQEKLFCWHVLPLDVYLENEHELSTAAAVGQVVEELKGTVGEKLMSRDVDTRIVINFHGVSFCFLFISLRFTLIGFLHVLSTRSHFISSVIRDGSFTLPLNCTILSSKHPIHLKERMSTSHTHTECRAHRPRLPPINLPLHLRHPKNSPPNLRLPRLRTFHP